MTNILSVIHPFCHLSYILVEWVLLVWSIQLWCKSNSIAMIVLPILLVCSSYDNFVLLVGSLLGEGKLLESLSMLRFLAHYIVVPLFIVIVVELAHRAGADWAGSRFVRVLGWVLAIGLGIYDVATQFVGLELVPETFAGMLRYVAAQPNQLPIITILVNLFVMIIGIGIWRRLKWSWLFVGALVSLIGNAIPTDLVGTVLASVSELILALCMLLTEQRTQYMMAMLKLSTESQQSQLNLQTY
ncbi:MAG: hypothetical protein HXY43_23065 [Fischerella sp.]|uniref:hypothetical protein n=1 Tax=Fischerella sp. TaxID=1191 RepID=UPI00184879CE|nr:hypothetical protein [Fischerella sp.]NWF62055.1 hypothetical protein [Fischerella sp.]